MSLLPKHRKAAAPKSFLREIPVLLLIAVLLSLMIKTFIVQAFFIPSGSMEQTLRVGDRVVVNKLVYRFRDIHRGDVVVFNGLDSFVQDSDARIAPPPSNPVERVVRGIRSLTGMGDPGERDFIKRVIGLPGDTVACCADGRVTVNGVPLEESGYLFQDDRQRFAPVVVERGKIWVMGDHRSKSSDSRVNGQVPASRVLGRAVVVVWPVGHAKGLRAPATFEGRPRVPVVARVASSPIGLASALTLAGWGVRRRRGTARRRTASQ
jgi:signal peptidase I